VTRAEIERDVARMFSGNFRAWVGLSARGGQSEPSLEEIAVAEG
jgi:hypothetical protein